MLENKLYKRTQSKRTPERDRGIREIREQKPIYLYRNSKEILCAFSLKLASVSIISGVEFRVRISCFLKLDSSVFGAETGTESHSIQIKDFIHICDLVARSSFFFF
ncbi:hypothetical protein Peur_031932 [Populus x canadensis]